MSKPSCGSCGLVLRRLEVGICRLCAGLVVTVENPEHIRTIVPRVMADIETLGKEAA